MNKRILVRSVLVLGLILGIGFGTSTVSADLSLSDLTWSVQSLVDESEQVFSQCQNVNPRSVRGLALSHDGNYLYLSYLQNPDYAGRVRKIDLSVADFEDQVVNELQLIIHYPGTPNTSAKALAVDDQGRVYMARGDGIQIWSADLGLGGSGVSGTEGTGSILPQYTLTGLNDSRGVATTREGGTLVMYVSDNGDDTLERYELTESAGSVTGATRVGFGTNATDGLNNGELNLPGAVKPIGLEVAPDGTIWIADQDGDVVYRVNPDGTFPSPSSVSVNGAFDVAFDGNTALVSNGDGTVEAFNVADMSALTTVTPPFAALDLRSLPGTNTALTGIDAIPGVAFYVAIEDGERPEQTIEGCADDADDNAPVLKAYVDYSMMLWVEPDDGWVEECADNIIIDVRITANDMNGVEFDLDFDDTLLHVVNVTAGSMWSGHNYNVVQNTVSGGTIEFAVFLQEADTDMDVTDGQVARIEFHGDDAGISALDLNDAIASTIEGEAIEPVLLEDGTLTVFGHGCVEGVVEVQGRSGPDWDGALVTVSGGPGGGYSYNTPVTNSDGTWEICDIVEGDYDVAVEMALYLDGLKQDVSITDEGHTDVGQVKVLGGDCNDSDGVLPCGSGPYGINVLDATIVADEFGNTSPTDARADINDDNTVNILDAALLGGNWHKCSPVNWP